MSETLRDRVARAMWDTDAPHTNFDRAPPGVRGSLLQMADAAIALCRAEHIEDAVAAVRAAIEDDDYPFAASRMAEAEQALRSFKGDSPK